MGRKELALIHGDEGHGRVKAVMLSLPSGNDSVSAEARLTLVAWLQLKPLIEAPSGEQRLVLASEQCPMQDEVDVIVEVLEDYGWQMLVGGRPQLQAVRWSGLYDCLSGGHVGTPFLTPTESRNQGQRSLLQRSLLGTATVRALESALHSCHEAGRDV